MGVARSLGRCPRLSHFAPLGLPKPRSSLPNQNRRAPHEVRGHAPNIGISSHCEKLGMISATESVAPYFVRGSSWLFVFIFEELVNYLPACREYSV